AGRGAQDVAGPQRAVDLEVLLGVEATAATAASPTATAGALGARRLLAGTEPPVGADLRAKEVVGVELGARLGERRRGDHLRRIGDGAVEDRVRVTDRASEHHDVARLHTELLDSHAARSP